jgi:hypothetical protein
VYDEALRNGETLLTVPCSPAARYGIGRELISLGAHGVIYSTGISVETLTGP